MGIGSFADDFSTKVVFLHYTVISCSDGVGSSVDVHYTRQMEEETNRNKWNRGSGSNFGSNQIYRETVGTGDTR